VTLDVRGSEKIIKQKESTEFTENDRRKSRDFHPPLKKFYLNVYVEICCGDATQRPKHTKTTHSQRDVERKTNWLGLPVTTSFQPLFPEYYTTGSKTAPIRRSTDGF